MRRLRTGEIGCRRPNTSATHSEEDAEMHTSNWMRKTHVSLGFVVLAICVVMLALAFYFR